MDGILKSILCVCMSDISYLHLQQCYMESLPFVSVCRGPCYLRRLLSGMCVLLEHADVEEQYHKASK